MQIIKEEGGKYEFGMNEAPPEGPSAKTPMDITAVGTKNTPKENGSDTYVNFPGDGASAS